MRAVAFYIEEMASVRHPRQTRWLDEWDRLKGGRFTVKALKSPRAVSILLVTDVDTDLFQLKTNCGECLAA